MYYCHPRITFKDPRSYRSRAQECSTCLVTIIFVDRYAAKTTKKGTGINVRKEEIDQGSLLIQREIKIEGYVDE